MKDTISITPHTSQVKDIREERMERADFVLPEWTRTIYSHSEVEEKWRGRIQEISQAWQKIEVESIRHNIRHAAIQTVSPEQLPQHQAKLAKDGLSIGVLSQQRRTSTYQASGAPPKEGKPFNYKICIARPNIVSDFVEAYQNNDTFRMGELLGYPHCCQLYFEKYWVQENWKDPTWPMYENSNFDSHGPWQANILLRWLGVRAVPHLPCSFQCEETVEFGEKLMGLMEDKFPMEYTWLRNMLNWPVQWSACHGIAIIKTPICKISTRTDATYDRYILNKPGKEYPEEGASGTVFPYQNKHKAQLTESPSFERSLEQSDLWDDNGFSSKKAQKKAHEVLLKTVDHNFTGTVLDLGCGNGALLEKIRQLNPEEISGFGVEKVEGRVFRGSRWHPELKLSCGSIEDTFLWANEVYDLIILMPGRLDEMKEEDSSKVLEKLKLLSKNFLFYAYSDHVEKYDQWMETYFSWTEPIRTERQENAIAEFRFSQDPTA